MTTDNSVYKYLSELLRLIVSLSMLLKTYFNL